VLRHLRYLLLALCLPLPLFAQKVALSLDDAPFLRPSPRLAAPAQHRAMLETLKARKVRAILFANGVNGGDTPEGRALLQAWGEAGHLLANHSYSHWDLNMPKNLPGGEALAEAVAAEAGQQGFVKAWRARNAGPDDQLFSERRLAGRMDQLGL
jgi:peptidoglycan/xylan/chitin deacetylase (PgdA/CDA1 family)